LPVIVRPSLDADITAIAAIYAHHVAHGVASFEIHPPALHEMAARRTAVLRAGWPYLAAQDASGAVVGYAYAATYRPRPAYRFTVEDSIYIHPAHAGQGIGTALLTRLIEECREKGARQMVAVIGGRDNTASIRLHQRLGYRTVGVLEAVGFKFERWVDSVLMQRSLAAEQPAAVLPEQC
jgi:L-amino acid N-acyltransferase YncA